MFLYEVIDSFKKAKVPFVLVGGYALAFQGIVRATTDVDIVISLAANTLEKAEAGLNSINLTSRIPVRAQDIAKFRKEYIEERNLIAWSFVDFKNPLRQLDVLITMDISEVKSDKILVSGRQLQVATLESLLKMKKQANRDQDKLDIIKIQEILQNRNTKKNEN